MGRHPASSYPWHKENNNVENDSLSRPSFESLSRCSSEDYSESSSDTPGSPKAVDPEDLECQVFYCDTTRSVSSSKKVNVEKEQKLLLDEEEEPSTSKKDDDDGRDGSNDDDNLATSPSPRANRWWEPQPATSAPRWWETISESSRSLHSLVSPSVSTPIPPPPAALRSSRRLSLPGAFPIAGIGGSMGGGTRRRWSDGYRGEEEKFEDEHSSSSFVETSSARDELAEMLLLEATLVSEKSSRLDVEQRSNEIVFQAEPLQIKQIFTLRSICCLICLLLLIAVVGIAAGTELGRRRYENKDYVEETPPPRNPNLVDVMTATFPPTDSLVSSNSNSEMAAPPGEREDVFSLAPSATPPIGETTIAPSLTATNLNTDLRFLDLLPDKTKMSVENPGSPQFQAYKWLLADPKMTRYKVAEQIQRFALATLYYAANGPEWDEQNGWMSYGIDTCDWYSDALIGLLCNDDMSYEILSLNENSLNGTLPDEVWLLSTLVSLQFYDHQALGGTIATRVGKMPYLESLLLFDLNLQGSIPKEIGHTKLKTLHVGGNALTGPLPPEIGNIAQLRHLYVNDNVHLNGTVPTELGRLTELQELALQNNSFVGSIPSEIGQATNLQLAYFAFNNLTGTITSEFRNLSNLRALILQSNSLKGPIPDLSSLSRLDYIFLGMNHLTGTIPADVVAAWESLMILDFGSNELVGSIPVEIGFLEHLQHLDLFNNSLEGPIPPELGKLYNAEKIMLEQNGLTGTIPSSFGALTTLQRLWLHDNDLSGSVPQELCALVEAGSLQSLSVDCHKVRCSCGCDCSMSMPELDMGVQGNAVLSKQGSEDESTSLWDNFVEWASNLFN